MEEDEGQGKQAKHKGVFLGFGDQSPWSAGHHQTQSARTRASQNACGHKIRADAVSVKILAAGGEREVAYGIGQSALSAPRNVVVCRVIQRRGAGRANAHIINGGVVEEVEVADGSGVGGGGGLEGDLGIPVGIGIGRQGMVACRVVSGGSGGREELCAGRKAEAVGVSGKGAKKSRVIGSCGSGGGRWDAAVAERRGAAGEGPDGLRVITLEGIDGEEELRLALFKGNKKRRKR